MLSEEGHELVGYFFNPNIHPYQEFLKRLHCLQKYTALRPVEVIYDKNYNLDKYLVGALEAMYDPPERYKPKTKPSAKDGAFSEKVSVKEQLEIRLTPKEKTDSSGSEISWASQSNTSNSINEPKLGKNNNSDFNPRCGYCIFLRLTRTAALAAESDFDAFTTTLLESKYQPHDYIRSIGTELAAKHDIDFYYKDFRSGWKESVQISKELDLYRQQYCGCIFSEYERFGPD